MNEQISEMITQAMAYVVASTTLLTGAATDAEARTAAALDAITLSAGASKATVRTATPDEMRQILLALAEWTIAALNAEDKG